MSHTPGPWHFALPGGPQGPFWGLVNSQGIVVALQIVSEADATLCAAAPELLTSIKTFLDAIDDSVDELDIEAFNAYGQCVEAIAKAEGRQP